MDRICESVVSMVFSTKGCKTEWGTKSRTPLSSSDDSRIHLGEIFVKILVQNFWRFFCQKKLISMVLICLLLFQVNERIINHTFHMRNHETLDIET